MYKKMFAAAAVLAAVSTPAIAQQDLHAAIVAAMGEAIEDPRYADVLASYGLDLPDLSDPSLVNSSDHPYPDVTDGSLLARVFETGTLRLGWIAVGSPWSVPGEDPSEPVGLSIDYWALVQEYLSRHYGTEIALDWVEYTDEVGNNNMYRWLATSDDPNCDANGREVNGCYDAIGGAYAINARRRTVSNITPAYFPLNMSVVRTHVPLPDGVGPLNSAEDIREAMADPDINLVLAGLPDTGRGFDSDQSQRRNGWDVHPCRPHPRLECPGICAKRGRRAFRARHKCAHVRDPVKHAGVLRRLRLYSKSPGLWRCRFRDRFGRVTATKRTKGRATANYNGC